MGLLSTSNGRHLDAKPSNLVGTETDDFSHCQSSWCAGEFMLRRAALPCWYGPRHGCGDNFAGFEADAAS